MSYKPRSLFRILTDIEQSALLLPHIQRAFVWDEEQIIRLFDSLMRNYPVQTLLFWKTQEAIRARRFMPSVDREVDLSSLYDPAKSVQGVEKTFVLDGQQRLQSLYAMFRGTLTDPHGQQLEAYLDITQGSKEIDGSDLLYRLAFSATPLPLPHYRLRNLTEADSQKDAASIAYDIQDRITPPLASLSQEEGRALERLILRNISQLRTLLREEQHFWIEELDGVANSYEYRRILDIFVRVNSGGTKLTASDLMFAALKEGWDDIEENTEQTVDMLNLEGRLAFDATFPLKCLLVAHGEGAEVNDTSKFTGSRGEELLRRFEDSWPRAEQAFQQLRDFIEHDLRLSSDRLVRSYNAFVPLFSYLYQHPKPNESNRARMRAYFYKTQLFGWFGASGDTTINAVQRILNSTQDASFPLAAIVDYFQQRGLSTDLQDHHLADNRLRSILLSILYIQLWGTSPFNVRFKGNEPHVDHIYPQSMLRSQLGQRSYQINDIGNLRYVGATDNIRKRAELPSAYFSRLKDSNVDISRHLIVRDYAEDPSRLEFSEAGFTTFREARKAEIRRVLKSLIDLAT